MLLDRLATAEERPVRVPEARDPRLGVVCRLLGGRPVGLARARRAGSRGRRERRTLTRLFQQDTGLTFPQWRTQLRLYQALRLLAENTPMTTVARECGFATASAFIDVFRRSLGHTPGYFLRG